MKTTEILRLHDTFCLEAQMMNYRPSTLRWWRHALDMFLGHFPEGEVTRLKDLTFERLRDYFYDKYSGGWTADTFSNQYRALKAFLSWCVKQGHLAIHPMDGLQKPRLEKKLPKRISFEDAKRVLEFAFHGPAVYTFERYRNRALLGTMLYAGLRASETLNLKVADIDFTHVLVYVRCGKGGKDRVVPLHPTLAVYLREYLKDRERVGKRSSFLFTPVKEDQALGMSGLKRMIARTRRKSGVNFSAHKLRHTFATLMVEVGCELSALQAMMGHSSVETTMLYVSTSVQHLKDQMAKHPLGRPRSEYAHPPSPLSRQPNAWELPGVGPPAPGDWLHRQ